MKLLNVDNEENQMSFFRRSDLGAHDLAITYTHPESGISVREVINVPSDRFIGDERSIDIEVKNAQENFHATRYDSFSDPSNPDDNKSTIVVQNPRETLQLSGSKTNKCSFIREFLSDRKINNQVVENVLCSEKDEDLNTILENNSHRITPKW